jgi:hypothetical protein
MATLRKDPVAWANSAVGTPTRYWCMVACFVFLYALLLAEAGASARSILGVALFLASFQFMFLYALRRLSVEIKQLKTVARRGREANYLTPPSQIRTCRATAYGSRLGSDVQTLVGIGVADVRWGQPLLGESRHSSPTDRTHLRASLQAAQP